MSPRSDHDQRQPATTIVSPSGGGLYFYSGTTLPIRHVWIIDKYIRPDEVSLMRNQLDRVRHVAFTNETGLTEARFDERVRDVFGAPVRDLWRGRVSPIEQYRGWSLVSLTGHP